MSEVTPTRPERAKALMQQVRHILLDHHEGERMAVAFTDGVVLLMYSRLRSLLEGSCTLLEAGLPEEASLLVREMLADSLRLAAISDRGKQRDALILGMMNEAFGRFEHWAVGATNLGTRTEEWLGEVRRGVEARRRDLQAFARDRGIEGFEKFSDEKTWAKKLGLIDDYVDFTFMHLMVHQPMLAQSSRMRRTDGDKIDVYLRGSDDDAIASIALGAMTAALRGHAAVCSIFAWSETDPATVDDLLGQIDVLAEELAEAGRKS